MKKPAVVASVVAVVLAVGAYLALRPKSEPPVPPPVPAPEQKPADAPLPPAAQSDATLRSNFGNVSSKISQWLLQPDLLDRIAALVGDLVRDESPRKALDFLAPKTRFSSTHGHIDPKSYERYDDVADAIASVDVQKLVAGVKAVHPLLESAYHRLADPNRSFDDAVKAALQRIVDAPVVEGEIAVVPHGANDLFADEKLEVLGPVEKHLIRMGPKNEKAIQAKAREFLAAF
ncbi:MAG TPA: DUF3014 domain-containing protein [Myxococcales bacterium]|jgi:hypothetical protein